MQEENNILYCVLYEVVDRLLLLLSAVTILIAAPFDIDLVPPHVVSLPLPVDKILFVSDHLIKISLQIVCRIILFIKDDISRLTN